MKKTIAAMLIALALVLVIAGCDKTPAPKSTSKVMSDQYALVAAQANKLASSQPAPEVNYSATRAQVSKRIVRWSDPNRISYVYLVSYGRVMAFYTVKGSIESKRSYLFPVTAPINKSGYSGDYVVVDTPDIDGTYGDNADSVFFFTTDDVYVEWSGDYMWVDQPLKLSTQPELVYTAPLK